MTDDDLDVLAAMARMVPESSKPVALVCLNDAGGICFLYHSIVTAAVMTEILKAAQKSVSLPATLQ